MAVPDPGLSRPTRLIDGTPPSWREYCAELWRFREVGELLIRRDLIVRFRQTYFGLAWMLFKPLMLMLVLNFVFGMLSAFNQAHEVPYPLIVFCGVIPWYLVSNAVPDGMNALHSHIYVIQKTYFPRAIIPMAAVAVDTLEFLAAWLLFALACLFFGFLPGWQCLLFPLFCLQLVLLCAGVALWLSVLNLRFRDIGNLVPFGLTIGFFVSPVGYTMAQVPDQWRLLYSLNPLAGIIEGLRWSLLGGFTELPLLAVLVSLILTCAIAVSGVRHFLAMEYDLAEFA